MGKGRKPFSEEDRKFASLVGSRLDDAIEAQDLTRDEAAEKLGIHRSMLFRYLAGRSVPGSKVLRRACKELGLSVTFRGLTLDAGYFRQIGGTEKPLPIATQTEFAFMRDSFAGQFARVDIRRKKHSGRETLELKMTIQLGKHDRKK
jgi:transcriptional regulator with XRE-family HTH domain